MGKKLKSSRGETLIEVLASILVGTLSIALLFGAVMASRSMDKTAEDSDKAFYEALSAAEEQTEAVSFTEGMVKVSVQGASPEQTTTIDVDFYGGKWAMSFAPGTSGGGGS